MAPNVVTFSLTRTATDRSTGWLLRALPRVNFPAAANSFCHFEAGTSASVCPLGASSNPGRSEVG